MNVKKATASVSAKPSQRIACSSSFISGWRATDSISEPKMMPMPMPAPIEPRPAPTPRAIDFPAFSTSPVTAAMVVRSMVAPLVTRGGCSAEVDRGEGRKDERLKGRYQPQLEHEECEGERERQQAQGGDAEEDGEPSSHE